MYLSWSYFPLRRWWSQENASHATKHSNPFRPHPTYPDAFLLSSYTTLPLGLYLLSHFSILSSPHVTPAYLHPQVVVSTAIFGIVILLSFVLYWLFKVKRFFFSYPFPEEVSRAWRNIGNIIVQSDCLFFLNCLYSISLRDRSRKRRRHRNFSPLIKCTLVWPPPPPPPPPLLYPGSLFPLTSGQKWATLEKSLLKVKWTKISNFQYLFRHWIFLQLKTTRIYSLKVLPCVMLCSFEFALRNTLSFKLNFCVQIYFCVLCDSRIQKRNSEFNLSFWPHPRIPSRCIPIRVASRTRPNKNYVQIQKKLHLDWGI